MYEPYDHDDPENDLASQLRALRLGGSIDLARGVRVKAVATEHGASGVRRYHVSGDGVATSRRTADSEQRRHAGTIRTAEEAAKAAISLSKDRQPGTVPISQDTDVLSSLLGAL
jgi:hypothetical protein